MNNRMVASVKLNIFPQASAALLDSNIKDMRIDNIIRQGMKTKRSMRDPDVLVGDEEKKEE